MEATRQREYYLAEPERFWIMDHGYVEVVGIPILIYGELDTFLYHPCEDQWFLCIGVVGASLEKGKLGDNGQGFATKEEAIASARNILAEIDDLRESINRRIEYYGLSPRYAYYPKEEED